jgi:hypothetical protein
VSTVPHSACGVALGPVRLCDMAKSFLHCRASAAIVPGGVCRIPFENPRPCRVFEEVEMKKQQSSEECLRRSSPGWLYGFQLCCGLISRAGPWPSRWPMSGGVLYRALTSAPRAFRRWLSSADSSRGRLLRAHICPLFWSCWGLLRLRMSCRCVLPVQLYRVALIALASLVLGACADQRREEPRFPGATWDMYATPEEALGGEGGL